MTADGSNSESDFISDELLSGYLDDELSDAERVRVESALESNERYRQILTELQTLRAGLGALPRQRVDADFQQRVLDRISNENQVAVAKSNVVVNSWRGNLRRNIMSFSAIATGITILIVSNWEPDTKVAVSPVESELPSVASNEALAEERADRADDMRRENSLAGSPDPRLDASEQEVDSVERAPRISRFSLAEDRVADLAMAENSGAAVPRSASNPIEPSSVPSNFSVANAADPKGALNSQIPTVGQPAGSSEVVRIRPKYVAAIAQKLRQLDQVDLVVSVYADDSKFLPALLPPGSQISERADLRQQRKAEPSSDLLSVAAGSSPLIASLDAGELESLTSRFESAGRKFAVIDSAAILAKTSEPVVKYFYRQSVPDSRSLRARSVQEIPSSPASDLYLDLDVGPDPSRDESVDQTVAIPQAEGAVIDSQEKLRVLFVVFPVNEVP